MPLKSTQINFAILVRIEAGITTSGGGRGGSGGETTTTSNFTSLDIPVWFNFEKYNPRAMEITNIDVSTANQVSEFSFKLDNTDNYFDNLTTSLEIRGRKTDIYIVELDNNFKVVDFLNVYSGYIDRYVLTDKEIEITLTDELVFWTKETFRKHTYDLFPSIKDVEEQPLLWGSKTLQG